MNLISCKKAIGIRQSEKAILNGSAKYVYIAEDADYFIKNSILGIVNKNNVPFEYVASKKLLGSACGIEVSAAVVALLI